VRDRALALIEAGGDAELYEEGAPARLRTLRRLADKLTGPQPKPKKLRGPRPGPDPGVEVGDVVRIWSSDRSAPVLYAATRMHEHERKRRPELLGCTGRAARCPRGTSSSAFPTCPGSASARWVRRPAVRPLRLGRAV